jgi:hypothetical protein
MCVDSLSMHGLPMHGRCHYTDLYCGVRGYKPSKELEQPLTIEAQRGLYITLASAKNRDNKAMTFSLLIKILLVPAARRC